MRVGKTVPQELLASETAEEQQVLGSHKCLPHASSAMWGVVAADLFVKSVLGLATGSCWTYASGKVVVVTPRTGHVLLKICGTGDGVLPAVNAADGKVWVAAAEAGEPTLNTLGMKIAITTSPETLSVWRQSLKGQEAPGTLSLDWLEAGDQADDFLPVAALLSAMTGDELLPRFPFLLLS
eukprot:s4257_g4.t1